MGADFAKSPDSGAKDMDDAYDRRPDPVYAFAQQLLALRGGPPALIVSAAFVLGVEFAIEQPDTAARMLADERGNRSVDLGIAKDKLRVLARAVDDELALWYSGWDA